MPQRDYDNWEALVSAVSSKTEAILLKHVAPIAEEILKKNIKSEIYDSYIPKEGAWVSGTTYQRRHVLENNIKSTMMTAHTMLVTSYASASAPIVRGWKLTHKSPGSFLQLLETGNMGIWRSGFPRPAVGSAQAEIDDSTAIESAIRRGIRAEIEG